MNNWREQIARDCLEKIKMHTSPTIDRGDAHGAQGQAGAILYANSEPFALKAIMETIQTALDINPEKGDGLTTEGPSREYPARSVRWFVCEGCGRAHLRVAVNNRVNAVVDLDLRQWVDLVLDNDEFVAALAARLGRNR